jgi:hypothetical protein
VSQDGRDDHLWTVEGRNLATQACAFLSLVRWK